jgi:hypothetical protein
VFIAWIIIYFIPGLKPSTSTPGATIGAYITCELQHNIDFAMTDQVVAAAGTKGTTTQWNFELLTESIFV